MYFLSPKRPFLLILILFEVLSRLSFAQETVTLEELIAEALERNPAIQSALYDVQQMEARIPQAGTLPDPEIHFGQMNVGSVIPFTTLGEEGFSEVFVGFTQNFPLHGKRGLREKKAERMAAAQRWEHQSAVLELKTAVKWSYFEIAYWRKANEILDKNIELMDQFSKTAQILYEVGKGSQADVLRAQTESSRLQEQVEVIRKKIESNEARMNFLLNRPVSQSIGRLEPIEREGMSYSLEELMILAKKNSPVLNHQQEVVKQQEFSLELAKKERYPDIGIIFTYHNRGAIDDYWTIAGTTTIPIFQDKKQKKAVEEASVSMLSAGKDYEHKVAQLQFEIKDQYLEATTSDRLAELYGRTIVPQESLSLESVLSSYSVGSIEFLSVLDTHMKLLHDELSYWEYLKRSHQAVAKLELLVGSEFGDKDETEGSDPSDIEASLSDDSGPISGHTLFYPNRQKIAVGQKK